MLITLCVVGYLVAGFLIGVGLAVADHDRDRELSAPPVVLTAIFWPFVAVVYLFASVNILCERLVDWIVRAKDSP